MLLQFYYNVQILTSSLLGDVFEVVSSSCWQSLLVGCGKCFKFPTTSFMLTKSHLDMLCNKWRPTIKNRLFFVQLQLSTNPESKWKGPRVWLKKKISFRFGMYTTHDPFVKHFQFFIKAFVLHIYMKRILFKGSIVYKNAYEMSLNYRLDCRRRAYFTSSVLNSHCPNQILLTNSKEYGLHSENIQINLKMQHLKMYTISYLCGQQ